MSESKFKRLQPKDGDSKELEHAKSWLRNHKGPSMALLKDLHIDTLHQATRLAFKDLYSTLDERLGTLIQDAQETGIDVNHVMFFGERETQI
jgi:hypothetical protein